MVVLTLQRDWVELMSDWSWSGRAKWGLVVAVLVAATAVGGKAAQMAGRSLRVLAQEPVVDANGNAVVDENGNVNFTWKHQQLANPRGVAVGWSVLYGVAYEVLVVVLLADPLRDAPGVVVPRRPGHLRPFRGHPRADRAVAAPRAGVPGHQPRRADAGHDVSPRRGTMRMISPIVASATGTTSPRRTRP